MIILRNLRHSKKTYAWGSTAGETESEDPHFKEDEKVREAFGFCTLGMNHPPTLLDKRLPCLQESDWEGMFLPIWGFQS